jgi:protein-tyrosine-phosphatase/tRNA A37 threonylcarbamoyladenosine synthetase subunit TsaC/SUA5/YrdC
MADHLPWPGDLLTLNDVCARLRSGQLVGVATEGGFEALASGGDAKAVARLAALVEADVPVAVALASPREVFDWAPHLRGAGLRLARDFWPGSLVLVTPLGLPFGLLPRLPTEVRKHLERAEGIALRLSPRDDLSNLFSAFGGPLVIAPVAASEVDVVLDFAPPGPASEITVVAAGERDIRVLRAGALRRDDLEASARTKIVFVCTGNTCRSPMAEVLCRRLLADTLGVAVSDLGTRGYEVESAGMAAANGEPASPEAVAVAEQLGGDLAGHASQPLTMELVDRADHLFTMTTGHLRMLHSLRLPVGPEPQLLSLWGEDVPDPIGGPMELYQACAEQIRRSLRERLPQILEG